MRVRSAREQASYAKSRFTMVGYANVCDWRTDGAQKQLNGLLDAYAESIDPAKQGATRRLQGLLVLGIDVAQTMSHDQTEVVFGRKQVALVAAVQGSADMATLGLGPTIHEIDVAMEALASVIGYSASVAPPSTYAA